MMVARRDGYSPALFLSITAKEEKLTCREGSPLLHQNRACVGLVPGSEHCDRSPPGQTHPGWGNAVRVLVGMLPATSPRPPSSEECTPTATAAVEHTAPMGGRGV